MAEEAKLENDFSTYAKKRGCLSLKWVSPGRAGVPDRIVLCPGGIVFFIEFKAKSGRLSRIQERNIKALRGLDQIVYILDDLNLSKIVLERHLE